jgi:very-short-patch-repair endonuclease
MGEIGRDERRDADLARRGVDVLRISASEVRADLDGVLATIAARLTS